MSNIPDVQIPADRELQSMSPEQISALVKRVIDVDHGLWSELRTRLRKLGIAIPTGGGAPPAAPKPLAPIGGPRTESRLVQIVENAPTPGADPAAAGSVLAKYYTDYCDETGMDLDELGWGVDTPEHIAAIEAGAAGTATEQDVKLIVDAINTWAYHAIQDFEYATPEFVQAYKAFGGTEGI